MISLSDNNSCRPVYLMSVCFTAAVNVPNAGAQMRRGLFMERRGARSTHGRPSSFLCAACLRTSRPQILASDHRWCAQFGTLDHIHGKTLVARGRNRVTDSMEMMDLTVHHRHSHRRVHRPARQQLPPNAKPLVQCKLFFVSTRELILRYMLTMGADVRIQCHAMRATLRAILSITRAVLNAASSCMVLSEVIVVLVTWSKTFKVWKESRRLGVPISITTCLLRDGESPVYPSSHEAALTFSPPHSGTCYFL